MAAAPGGHSYRRRDARQTRTVWLSTRAYALLHDLATSEQLKSERQPLAALRNEPRTMILYESPHRLRKLLHELVEYLGADRRMVIARELTKHFEEVVRGTTASLLAIFQDRSIRGEFTLVIAEHAGKYEQSPGRSSGEPLEFLHNDGGGRESDVADDAGKEC